MAACAEFAAGHAGTQGAAKWGNGLPQDLARGGADFHGHEGTPKW